MARIRTIKPEFWTDDDVCSVSIPARLLFIGIWNFADDYGNIDRSAKQIKRQVFPDDSVDAETLIQELIGQELLLSYQVDGKEYLHISGFTKHQIVNKPSAPKFPPPVGLPEDYGSTTERKGREGKGREVKKNIPATPEAKPASGPPLFPKGSDPYELAGWLRDKILENNPGAKVPPETEKGLSKWALEIDRMLRLDKRDPDDIGDIIAWAQGDDFWRANILSARNLRKHFDRLLLQSGKADSKFRKGVYQR